MDADKIKEFFLYNFEKMILVVVIGASGFLIYQGMQLPDFLEKEQPDNLTAEATQVKSAIDEDHNDAIIPERVPTFDIVKETERIYASVEPTPYEHPNQWDPSIRPGAITRRQDPALSRPESLLVMGVSTAIAVRGSTTDPDDYELALLEDAEPVEKVEKKERPQRRSRRRGGMDEMMMDEMMDMEMEMEMDMEYDMEDMMGMGASMGGGAGRRFDGDNDFGYRPSTTEDKKNPVPSIGWFIAGTAVVPHKELFESFELALKGADGYNPRRDTPFYFNFEVQRADVTDKPVDQLTDDDWVATVQANDHCLWDRELYTKLAAYRWSGFAAEIVPDDYRDDALTLWIPPILMDDYDWFSTHPLIPMLSQDELKKIANEALEEEDEGPIDLFAMDDVGLVDPGATPSVGGMDYMDMEMDMEMDMMEEMDMMGMGAMMMGMGMAMMGRQIETDPVDYKLVRFYDFYGFPKSPKPGRKYVYRLRYSVNDPNFPFSQLLQPKTNTLSPEVLTRVQALMADARENRVRSFQRWSEWSEPSQPVSLPSLEHYYVGPVDRGTLNTWQVRGKDVVYARDIPKAKILASQYDIDTGARIPMRLDVTEGSVLSHKAESADVVDPITLRVKKWPDAEIISSTTIVDIDGGAPLSITEDLKSPGMMLLFDQSGKLKVSSEVDDLEYYRIYSYADERGE